MAEVVTGEAVVLDLAVARFPGRMLALVLDIVIQVLIVALLLVTVFYGLGRQLDAAGTAAVASICYAVVVIGYPTIFETVTRGRTPGKMALGLRVVSDDGGPVRFRQALLRALSLAFVEVWDPLIAIFGMPAGLITAMVSAKGKRLGDLIAGTFVISERVPARADLPAAVTTIPPALAEWSQALELSRLSDQTAAAVSGYLRRLGELRPAAREHLGWQLASSVAAQVSPPPPAGTPPVAYLAAVLAVRRQREQARLGVPAVPWPGQPPGFPPYQPTPVANHVPPPGRPGYPAPAPAAWENQQPLPPGMLPPLPGHQVRDSTTSPPATMPYTQPATAGQPMPTAHVAPAAQAATAGQPAPTTQPASAGQPERAGQPDPGTQTAPAGQRPGSGGYGFVPPA
jgi:uncharacterized RDD family membrane protein YckC